jgi:hypothetical protein
MLGQCRELVHLNLSENYIGTGGAKSLAGVLAQRTALAAGGAGRLAGVLAQCPALAHLDLNSNDLGIPGAERLAGGLAQCTALAHLDLSYFWQRGLDVKPRPSLVPMKCDECTCGARFVTCMRISLRSNDTSNMHALSQHSVSKG